MIEKLLENWLDNASERSYQAVFVQMLAADGYRVLHSTRHCTQEYGKDILAIAPDGVGCAFQLKGDPGHRMNVTQFRSMQTQLVQLMAQRPSYPGFPKGAHRAYLVSNGQFAEEVQVAAHEMNNANYVASLELWSRGHLLDMCKKHGTSLWPSEIRDSKALLEIYMANPCNPVPIETLNGMLCSILSLNASDKLLKKSELRRSINSAAWATGICLSPFEKAENHYAVVIGWALCWSLVSAAAYRHAPNQTELVRPAAELCSRASLDSLAALWEEVSAREHLAQGNPMVDVEIYGWRISVLVGLLSTLAWADLQHRLLTDESRIKLKAWLSNTEEKPSLWGEGAVGQMLPWVLYLCGHGPAGRGIAVLNQLNEALIRANQHESDDAYATPHYSFETITRDKAGLREGTTVALHDQETFAGSSFTVDPLLKLQVSLGLKEEVKTLWPAFSKIDHRYYEAEEPWQYLLFKSSRGVESTRIYPGAYTWEKLVADIQIAMDAEPLLLEFESNPWKLFMWWQVAPHRVNASAVVGGAARVLLHAPDVTN